MTGTTGPGLLEWGVVADVAQHTFHGPGGAEVEAGLKHFRPGARVWVLPPRYWNEDDQVDVMGFHRGGHTRLVNMVIFRRHLENFRVKAVFSPTPVQARGNSWGNWNQVWRCPTTAQPWADRWNALSAGPRGAEYPGLGGSGLAGRRRLSARRQRRPVVALRSSAKPQRLRKPAAGP